MYENEDHGGTCNFVLIYLLGVAFISFTEEIYFQTVQCLVKCFGSKYIKSK